MTLVQALALLDAMGEKALESVVKMEEGSQQGEVGAGILQLVSLLKELAPAGGKRRLRPAVSPSKQQFRPNRVVGGVIGV